MRRSRPQAARQAAQVAEARVEDRVREADRIDPDVNHRSGDYTPQAPGTGTHQTQHDTVVEPTPGLTRATGTTPATRGRPRPHGRPGHTPGTTPTEPTTTNPADGTTPGSHRA